MRRSIWAVPAVAAVVATAVAVAAPHAGAQTGATAHPDQTRTVTSSIAAGRLLFVGASYSIGLGATGPGATIPVLVGRQLGRPVRVDAVSGTGFQNPGAHHQGTFAERIARDEDQPPPRIVVIQGGRDDVGFPVDHEYDAAYRTIDLARQRFPQAQVVVLGPIPASLPVNPRVLAIRTAIAAASKAAGAGFVDPIAAGWITPQNVRQFRGRVPGHPNDAGYAYLAQHLLLALPVALDHAKPAEHPGSTAA